MLILKKNYPEKSDLAICTVTKIQFNSIFVILDEYVKKQGIIHISEISPGRIRNIRDYVKEGKVIVCVVLRVNRERDLIELSLRRVTEGQRRSKINGMKQEQKAEKLVEFVCKNLKKDHKELLKHIISKITPEYDSVHTYFEDIINESETLERLELDKKVASALEETIRQRIKPPEVIIKGRFKLESYKSDGVEIIKKALIKAKKIETDKMNLIYLGAGKYDISLKAEDYKKAEKILAKVVEVIEKEMKKKGSIFEFNRTDR